MRTIYAQYNRNHDSIDVYTSAGYMLRINCWEAEKNLKTTYVSECALTSLAVDEPLEYARLYLSLIHILFIFRRKWRLRKATYRIKEAFLCLKQGNNFLLILS